jgi:arginine N-succinyltransferase
MYVRPVTLNDHEAILSLARQAGFGMTSLPPDAKVLQAKIEKAVKSFAGEHEQSGDDAFFFVLVDAETDEVVGTSGIKAHVGLTQPFYSYKLSTITHSSQQLGIFSVMQALHMVNDFTGASEIGSLFLLPEYRRDRLGRFLSRMRFLFAAEFRGLFDDRMIAEIRGMHDRDGSSPFYDSIARHFFQMDFREADYLNATQGNQFIADLMPKYPIYVNLLPKQAQEVIGKPYTASEPAKAMLELEGFHYNNYLDIFDGGPTLEARTSDIRAVKNSKRGKVVDILDRSSGDKYLLCTTGLHDFRSCMDRVEILKEGTKEDEIAILSRGAGWLNIEKGATVRYVRA